MGKCKAKAIQADLGTFSHNQGYAKFIQAYSGIFKALCNPGILRTVCMSRTLTYSEPKSSSQDWYSQKPRIFRMLAYSKSEAYSEP